MSRRPGEEVGGRYRLLAKIGAGAYGEVFRARDLETRDEVAIKFLKPTQAADPELVTRFEREAVAMARLRGTAAVYVHGMDRTKDGATYIVMEMLLGRDLESMLSEAEQRGGRLKKEKTLELLRPIATTLAKAHAKSIVHRDLKPSNIFVVDPNHGGGVRLMDFGLAKLLDAESLTAQGVVAGTPSYIAPEAWLGDSSRLDHRIDVYSLGVIVFRCLTGQVPYPTKSMMDLCRWAQSGERPSITELRKSLPPGMDDWVQKSLAIDPEKRFQSIVTQWKSLEHLLAMPPSRPF